MKNLKDPKTKIFPSRTRGGKELPSSSTLDSPSVMNKLATPPHAINSDMSQVIDDATSSMDNAMMLLVPCLIMMMCHLVIFLMNKLLDLYNMMLLNLMMSLCSDPTSNGQISVYTCHPWIGNADTHST